MTDAIQQKPQKKKVIIVVNLPNGRAVRVEKKPGIQDMRDLYAGSKPAKSPIQNARHEDHSLCRHFCIGPAT